MTVTFRVCAGCGATVNPIHFACDECWPKVPRSLRNRLKRALSAWTSCPWDKDLEAAYNRARSAAAEYLARRAS